MDRERQIWQALDAHGQGDALARLVRVLASSAADEHRTRFSDGLEEALTDLGIDRTAASIDGFSVLTALSQPQPPAEQGRRTIALLLVRGIALEPPSHHEEAQRIASALAWLSAHTYIDALSHLDCLQGEAAERLWRSLAELVRSVDEQGAPAGRAEALAAAVALSTSKHMAAREGRAQLRLHDPLLEAALAGAPATADAAGDHASARVSGEQVPAPSSPLALLLWCVSGLILLRYLWRFFTVVLLRAKRSADVTVDAQGMTLEAKLAVLGRPLSEQTLHIPVANIARAQREIRYPRLGLYAGLFALGVGTFIGAALFTDGARAGSPSLILLGAAIFALGVVIDLVVSSLWPGKQGKYRLLFVPRKGRTVAVRVRDEAAADRMLTRLSRAANPAEPA